VIASDVFLVERDSHHHHRAGRRSESELFPNGFEGSIQQLDRHGTVVILGAIEDSSTRIATIIETNIPAH
jgi:hypothetical protein